MTTLRSNNRRDAGSAKSSEALAPEGPAAQSHTPGTASSGLPVTAVIAPKILILEDVANDVELEQRELRKAGLAGNVKVVATRQDFVTALDEFEPDIILSDYNLPDFDGLAAVRIVRQKSADLPVILVTGVLGDEMAVQLIKAGITDYILKDRLARLGPAVQRALAEAEEVRRRKTAEIVRDELVRIVESARCAIFGADMQGIVTSWNEGAAEIYGYSVHDIVGKSIELLLPANRSRERGEWLARMSRGEEISAIEAEHVKKSGERIVVSLVVSPIRSATGETTGASAIARDITAQKLREQELARVHEQVVVTVGELQQRERDMVLIDDLNEILLTCDSSEEAYPVIAMTGQQLFKNTTGALAVFVSPASDLETVARWGAGPSLPAEFALGDCWALRRGQIHELEAIGKGPLCKHFAQPPDGAYMCVPLLVHGEALGLLYLGLAPGAGPGDDVRRLVRTFGELIKLSLSNLRLRGALRNQATHDTLTGLYNRRYLDEMLAREVQRAARTKSPLSVVMLDIDHFKTFNDTWGHDAGDHVLKEFAAILRSAIRSSDVVCRYGGEEFVLVLPDAEAAGAAMRLEKIRQGIQQHPMTFGGKSLPSVTVSAGVAQQSDVGTNAEELVAAADRALYSAKSMGRDCIRVFQPKQNSIPVALSNGKESPSG
jgi:diguanylate cyclase (GGDEF)-like protein/PAS domain S-box-containing protein